jgi:hypothetical protein
VLLRRYVPIGNNIMISPLECSCSIPFSHLSMNPHIVLRLVVSGKAILTEAIERRRVKTSVNPRHDKNLFLVVWLNTLSALAVVQLSVSASGHGFYRALTFKMHIRYDLVSITKSS